MKNSLDAIKDCKSNKMLAQRLYLGIGAAVLIGGALYYAFDENTTTAIKVAEPTKTVFYENDLNWNKETSYSCHLENKHTCTKEFEVTKQTKNLNISVRTVTWKNTYNNNNLTVTLWKGYIGKELIAEKSFSMHNMLDQNIYAFTLADVNLTPGLYTISFSSDADKQIGLGADRAQIGREYIQDEKHMQNSDLKILITE